jgi:hypothetical protein
LSQQALAFHEHARAVGWIGGDRQNALTTPTADKLNTGNYLLSYYKKVNGVPCFFQLNAAPYNLGGGSIGGSLICSMEH